MKTLLSQISLDSRKGGEADAEDQDNDHEGAEVETKALHGMVPERLKDDLLKMILSRV